MATYTVKKGDCLWSIAEDKLDKGTRWTEIRDLNIKSNADPKIRSSLKNSTIIQVGWVLELPSGSSTTKDSTASNKAVVEFLGPFAGEERTLFCTWSWSKDNPKELEKYLIEWVYTVEGGRTLYATETKSVDEGFDAATFKYTKWSVPENAVTVKVKVKPVPKETEKNGKKTTPWTVSGWSTIDSKSTFQTKEFPPETPPQPNLSIGEDGVTLTIRIDDIKLDDSRFLQTLETQVIKDDNPSKIYKSLNLSPPKDANGKQTTSVVYVGTVDPGARYKARCRIRTFRPDTYSEWTS